MRNSNIRIFTTLVIGMLVTAVSAVASYFEVTCQPSTQTNELQIGVTYRLWIPDGVKTIRGVIVHQHGCGAGSCKGAEPAARDLHWQALAKKWDCALLGPAFHQSEKQNCRLWCDPRNGSDKVFVKALSDLAAQSKHPELANAPWCLWGHSGGGFWASLMQAMYPERIIAIWFRSGTAFAAWEKGEVVRPEIPDSAMQIPMMCNPGVKENGDKRFNGAWTGTLEMFKAYRAKGAPIGFAPDPLTCHETGNSRYLAIPFFDACLAMRLPKKSSDPLKPVDFKQAWLAPLMGDEVVPSTKFSGDPKSAVWLPNERVAKAWLEYVRIGETGDTTPPPAPINVKRRVTENGAVELTWDAEADFESGLKAFVIQRDGKDLVQYPEKPTCKFGRPLFQSMSYGDTPVAPLLDFKYTDASAKPGEKHTYGVIAINSVGLRSRAAAAR